MKILVMVDVQNDFVTGALGTAEAVKILPDVCCKAEKLLSDTSNCLIYTMDTHNENYLKSCEGRKIPVVHCVEGTKGWELPEELQTITSGHENVYMVKKSAFGAAFLPECVKRIVRERKSVPENIELIGLCTDICVISNAVLLKSFFPEIEITVDSGCCAGTTAEAHRTAIEAMKMCHINIYNSKERC